MAGRGRQGTISVWYTRTAITVKDEQTDRALLTPSLPRPPPLCLYLVSLRFSHSHITSSSSSSSFWFWVTFWFFGPLLQAYLLLLLFLLLLHLLLFFSSSSLSPCSSSYLWLLRFSSFSSPPCFFWPFDLIFGDKGEGRMGGRVGGQGFGGSKGNAGASPLSFVLFFWFGLSYACSVL